MNGRDLHFTVQVLFDVAGVRNPSNEQFAMAKDATDYIFKTLSARTEEDLVEYHKFIQKHADAKKIKEPKKIDLDFENENEHGNTLLTYAAAKGHPDFVQLLLDAKANPNAAGKVHTPLTSATVVGRVDTLKVLIKAKADPNIRYPLIGPALTQIPYHYGQTREQTTRILLDAKADPNMPHPVTGMTPLISCAIPSDIENARVLIEAKADLSLSSKAGDTPLTEACYRNNEDLVKILLDAKVNINMPEPGSGRNALSYAVAANNIYILRALLAAKADPTIVNEKTGGTPLTEAVGLGNIETLQLLIEAKVDVNTPLDQPPLVLAGRKIKILQKLLDAKADANVHHLKTGQTALLEIISGEVGCNDPNNIIESIRVLLAAGANVNLANSITYQTPLISAVKQRNPVIIQKLLEAKARPNMANDSSGETPLLAAIASNLKDNVQALLEAKALPNISNAISGETPLIAAASVGNNNVVQTLLQNRAEINRANIQTGRTPLEAAIGEKYFKTNDTIIETLLQAKATADNMNSVTGKTPLIKAASTCNMGAIKLLLDAEVAVDAVCEKKGDNNQGKNALDIVIKLFRINDYGRDPNHDFEFHTAIFLLLSHHATITTPYILYELLLKQNQCAIPIFLSFRELCLQHLNKNGLLEKQQYQQVASHWQDLTQTINLTRVEDSFFDEANCQFPLPLKNLVRAYDFPLDRIGFFGTNHMVTRDDIRDFANSKKIKTIISHQAKAPVPEKKFNIFDSDESEVAALEKKLAFLHHEVKKEREKDKSSRDSAKEAKLCNAVVVIADNLEQMRKSIRLRF